MVGRGTAILRSPQAAFNIGLVADNVPRPDRMMRAFCRVHRKPGNT
jgi:hypothetical protein